MKRREHGRVVSLAQQIDSDWVVSRVRGGQEVVCMYFTGGVDSEGIWRASWGLISVYIFSHQARGGADGGGGTTVTAGNTRVSHCYHWPLRRKPLWAAKSLDWTLHLVPLTPLNTSVTLIGGSSDKKGGRGGRLSLRGGSHQETEDWIGGGKIKHDSVAFAALAERQFFCQSSHPDVSPQRQNHVTKRQRASVFGAGSRSGSRQRKVWWHSCAGTYSALRGCPPTTHTRGHQGQQTSAAVKRSRGFSFSLYSTISPPTK